jgi:hypothetical protein
MDGAIISQSQETRMNPRNQPPQPPMAQSDLVRSQSYMEFVQRTRAEIDTSKLLIELRKWAIEKATEAATDGEDVVPLAREITAFLAEPFDQTMQALEAEAKKKDAV